MAQPSRAAYLAAFGLCVILVAPASCHGGSGSGAGGGPLQTGDAGGGSTGGAGGGGGGGGSPAHAPNEPISIPAAAWSHAVASDVYVDGAPIGGLGAGSVTWRFDGAFYDDRLDVGAATQTVDPGLGFFMYQQAGSAAPTTVRLDQTLGAGQARYSSLFPRAWVDYSGPAFTCKVKVEQYSPILPGDYQRSSYPVGVYRWQIDNPTGAPCDVAIMLTFKNDHGGVAAVAETSGDDVGLVLQRGPGAATSATQGEITLASRNAPGVTVSYQSASSVAALQGALAGGGVLAGTTGPDALGAIAFKATVAPGGQTIVPIVLSWDIPLAQSGTGYAWYREYTRTFGRTGLSSWAIAEEALGSFEPWLWSIEDSEILTAASSRVRPD